MAVVFELLKHTGTYAVDSADTGKVVPILETDTSATDTGDSPIVIPKIQDDSPHYSAESWLSLKVSQKPDNQADNFRCWGSITPPSDYIRILLGTSWSNSTAGAPDRAILEDGEKSTVGGINYVDNTYFGPSDSISFDAASAKGYVYEIGERTNFLIMQIEVLLGAASGDMTTQVFNISYDES